MTLLALSVLAALAPIVQNEAASGSPDAVPGLERLIARLVPPERLAKVKNRVLRGTVRREGSEGVGEWIEMHGAPGEVRISARFDSDGSYEQGAHAGVVWETHPVSGVWIKDESDARCALRRYAWARLEGWKELYGKVSPGLLVPKGFLKQGDPDEVHQYELGFVEGESFDWGRKPDFQRIMIIPEGDIMRTRADMGLPWQLVLHERTQDGAPLRRIVTLSDWRAVDGLWYAHKQRIELGKIVLEVTYTSIEHDADLPPDAFDLPEAVAARHAGAEAKPVDKPR